MYSRHSRSRLLIAVLSILLVITPGSWTQCTPALTLRQLSFTPYVEYDSGTQAGTPTGCSLVNNPMQFVCPVGQAVISDGDNGPVNQTLSAVSGVLAWNQDVNITVAVPDNSPVRVTAVNLFFYNNPSMGIGLPHDISLSWGTSPLVSDNSLSHVVLGNQDLSENDNRRRNVTIAALADDPTDNDVYISVTVTFHFSNLTDIRWLLLSEIEICSSPVTVPTEDPIPVTSPSQDLIQLSPENIQTELNFTCMTEAEGSFQWTWTKPGEVTGYANANRTSSFTLTPITADSAGTFRCEVTYTTESPTGSKEFRIEFQPGAADLELLGASEVRTQTNTSVTLSCELYGYLSSGIEPQIIWQKLPSQTLTNNDPLYNITTMDGPRWIQNGGATPRASFISSLTINVVDESVEGMFVCSSSSFLRTVAVRVGDGPAPVTSSPTSVTNPPTSSSMIAIIAGAIGAVVVIILIIVVIVAIVLVMRAKRGFSHYHMGSNGDSKDFDTYDGGEPFYQEVSKPIPPPLPARFPSPMGSSQIDPYAMVNNATGNGHFELMEHSFAYRESVCSEPDSGMMPKRLNKQPNFLQNNPLYASADALDRADPPNLPFSRERGSLPPLDYSESPRGSAFNIYAQPSRIAPPIPDRPPTPTLLDGTIYSEANITPAVFKQSRPSPASPPDPEEHKNVMCPYASIYNNPQPLMRSEGPLEVMPRNVREIRNLGVGQFGQVVLAETVGVSLRDLRLSETNDDRSVSVLVAVKKLKPDADHFIKEAFEKEIKFMTRLRHENVVQLLGICLHDDAFIVMEYMESGDLNQYLRKSEIAPPDSTPGKNQLTPSTLLYIAAQIANGMKYLASFHFIHRDLATRNCLVGKNNEVKIADFGMSRSLYSSYYYRIRGRAMLPIRWMANECFYGKFSEKTDVWAFGVTMWEIYTFAKKQPYEDLTDQEVIDDAIKGPDRRLLTRPEHCPPEVFDVMVDCWVDDPDKRVNFNDVHSSLAEIYNSTI